MQPDYDHVQGEEDYLGTGAKPGHAMLPDMEFYHLRMHAVTNIDVKVVGGDGERWLPYLRYL